MNIRPALTDAEGRSLPLTITLVDGTEQVVELQSVALPRSVSIQPHPGDSVELSYRYSAGGVWFSQGVFTSADTVDDLNRQITAPLHSIKVQRTLGTSVLSVLEVA